MKVLQFILPLLIIADFMDIVRADDGLDMVAMKRPFCNAFTGCGRKRDPAYAAAAAAGAAAGSYGSVQLPSSVYRELLRIVAARNGAAEVRMRKRLARGSFESQEQLPRAAALF